MDNYVYRFVVLTLILITLVSCGGRSGTSASAMRLKIEPMPGVYILYDSRSNMFRMGNELVERRISMTQERRFIFTTAFINKLSKRNYVKSLGAEFSFRANGVELSGVTGDFEYVNHEVFGAGGVRGLEINLRAMREEIGLLKLRLVYEVYAHTPVVRKWIEVENSGGSFVTIDSVQVESLHLMPGSEYDLEVYSSEDASALSPVVFDTRLTEGFFAGNESPGALKYYNLPANGGAMSIGMRPHAYDYAAEIQLAPGERFVSSPVFIFFFKGEPNAAREALEKFVVEFIMLLKTQPYSVWYENILMGMTEAEARQKTQMAAESGADIFCLAGNWMDKRGDWNVNENVHIEKIGEYARGLGMKVGLSIELALADEDSQILAEYPQWAVKSEDSSDNAASGAKMMCLGSEYTLYAAQRLETLVRQLGVDYIKLTGPIIPKGCFAEDHLHRIAGESLWYIYDGLFAICRRLHSQHPDLVVDISTESYSPEGTIDYALLKYFDVECPF